MKSHLPVSLILAIAVPTAAGAMSLFSIDAQSPLLHELDPATGATLTTVAIVADGFEFTGGSGLAAAPDTGQLYALLKLAVPGPAGGSPPRWLAAVDPITGTASLIGSTGDAFSGLAFDASGTLYGVTGDGANDPETLYEISVADGSASMIRALGAGSDGEALAFNSADGNLYHASGHDGLCADDGVCFERIEIGGGFPTTNIDIEKSILQEEETMALAYWEAESQFVWAQDHSETQPFYHVDANGSATLVGETTHRSKGLAFADPISTPIENTSWGSLKHSFR